MAPMTLIRPAHIASVLCLTLAALLAASTVRATDDAQQPGSRPPAARPAPIPIDAFDKMPQDATAYCHDGTWSNAGTRKVACSSNGGVSTWFGPAPQGTTGRCKDGTYTRARKGTYGACIGNGGVRFWFDQTVPAPPRTD